MQHSPELKIAFLTREYPPDTAWGGIATLYRSLAGALSRQGHEIHVICQSSGRPVERVESGVFVHRVGTNPGRYSARARLNYSLAAYAKLKQLVRENRIDLVDTTMWGGEGFLFSLRKTRPLVLRADIIARDIISTGTYHGLKERLSLQLLDRLELFTLRRADRVITCSQSNYEQMRPFFKRSQRVDIAHLAVDTTRFRAVETGIRSELGFGDEIPFLLSVGRLEKRKGAWTLQQSLTEILRVNPSAVLVLVGRDTLSAPGGGSYKEYLLEEARLQGLENHLRFVDSLSPDRLIELYSTCQVYLAASEQESFGLTVIEALACSKLVVATRVGIVPELEQMEAPGLAVAEVGDFKSIAEAVNRFLSLSKDESTRLGEINRQTVEKEFSLSSWVSATLDIYYRTLGES